MKQQSLYHGDDRPGRMIGDRAVCLADKSPAFSRTGSLSPPRVMSKNTTGFGLAMVADRASECSYDKESFGGVEIWKQRRTVAFLGKR
jgi:hypothetical protein